MTNPHSDSERERTTAEEIARLVAQLVDEVKTSAKVVRYRAVNRGDRQVNVVDLDMHRTRSTGLINQLYAVASARPDVLVRRRLQPDKTQPDPAQPAPEFPDQYRAPRPDPVRYGPAQRRPQHNPGLVTTGAAVPSGSPGWDEDGALSPIRSAGYRSAPPTTGALDLLTEIESGVAALRIRLRAAAGRSRGPRRTTTNSLREIVGLALEVDDGLAVDTHRQIREWVNTARVLLCYDAPIVVLRDVYCPDCGGRLHVRADASSAVWCAGGPVQGPARDGAPWPVLYGPCGMKWPQGAWIKLLEQAHP
jgi:hypothetical protein